MKIIKDFLPESPRTHGGKMQEIKAIVVHWVGNPRTRSAKGIRKWFYLVGQGIAKIKGKKLYASSHFAIGVDGKIRALIPEDTEAFCNGGRRYTNYAKKEFLHEGKVKPNLFCLSIECAHPNSLGRFTVETEESLIWLCAHLMRKYKINNVIRHYDITKKKCPKYYVEDPLEWARLKIDLRKATRV